MKRSIILLILVLSLYPLASANPAPGEYGYITKDSFGYQRISTQAGGWNCPITINSDQKILAASSLYFSLLNYNPVTSTVTEDWIQKLALIDYKAVGDLDNDGTPEFLAYSDGIYSECLHSYTLPSGSLEWSNDMGSYDWTEPEGGILIGDIDGGGNEILYSCNKYPDRQPIIAVFSANNELTQKDTIESSQVPAGRLGLIAVTDLDQDGNQEIVSHLWDWNLPSSQLGFHIWERSGSGYQLSTIYGIYSCYDAKIGDVDSDGFDELVAFVREGEEYSVRVYDYTGNQLVEQDKKVNTQAHAQLGYIALGDFDSDNTSEIALLRGTDNDDATDFYFTIYSMQTGHITQEYTKAFTENRWSNPEHVETTDMNNDGTLDIIVTGSYELGIITYTPDTTEPVTHNVTTTLQDITLEQGETITLEELTITNQGTQQEQDLTVTISLHDTKADLSGETSITISPLSTQETRTIGETVTLTGIEPGTTTLIVKIISDTLGELDHQEYTITVLETETAPNFSQKQHYYKTPRNLIGSGVPGITTENYVIYEQQKTNGNLFLSTYFTESSNWYEVANYEYLNGKASLETALQTGYLLKLYRILKLSSQTSSTLLSAEQAPAILSGLTHLESIDDLYLQDILDLASDLQNIYTVSAEVTNDNSFGAGETLLMEALGTVTSEGFSLYTTVADQIFASEAESSIHTYTEKGLIHYKCAYHAKEIYTLLSKENLTENDMNSILYHTRSYIELKHVQTSIDYRAERRTWDKSTILNIIGFVTGTSIQEQIDALDAEYQLQSEIYQARLNWIINQASELETIQ